MLHLVTPTAYRRDAFLAAHREWGPGLHEDGFGIAADDHLGTAAGFASWLDRLLAGPGRVRWITDDDRVLGGIALRADGDPRAAEHGHLGYGVRPSARGRGIARWAVGQMLTRARDEGRHEVLAVCRDDNVASVRTIEKCGGVLTGTADRGGVHVRRYVIQLH